MPVAKNKIAEADAKAAVNAKRNELRDHPGTLGIIHRAMNSAARKAVAENDRLGIPTPGTDKDGRIVHRQPRKKRRRTRDAS